jgi:hypothetical protein
LRFESNESHPDEQILFRAADCEKACHLLSSTTTTHARRVKIFKPVQSSPYSPPPPNTTDWFFLCTGMHSQPPFDLSNHLRSVTMLRWQRLFENNER